MPNPFLAKRLESVRRAIAEKELDGLLLSSIVNIGYVSGFTGSTAFALVTPQEALFITDPRYTLRARRECPHFTLIQAAGSGGYADALKTTLAERPGLQKLGFEAGALKFAQWQQLQNENSDAIAWTPTEGLVEELRQVKDETGIAATRRAIAVAEAAFAQIIPLLRPGVSEREVAIELEFAMRRGGAEDRAFESIVASGEQGAHPHHRPNDRLLASGDFVTIDWGACVDGYHSDITRTVGIESLTDEQRRVYAAVLESQRLAIAAIAPGKTGKEIDAVARDYLTAAGHGAAFSHSLGHGLGLTVHDGLGLSLRGENVLLKPGMILTVEPGVYREGWGGVRIEEDVLVTDNGCETLTHLPNGLTVYG